LAESARIVLRKQRFSVLDFQTPFRLNVTTIKQLGYMAIDMDTIQQTLLIEAMNDFLIKSEIKH